MAAHAGFADDFDDFRRQGEIGLVPSVRITPARPEIGTTVELQVSGLARGQMRCSDGRVWDVQDGSRHRLPVHAPLHLRLLDEQGQCQSEVTVEPWFDRPTILDWAVPASVQWHLGAWRLPAPLVDAVQDMQLSWRAGPGQPWQPLAAGQALPIPRTRAVLGVRAQLRSRHAAFTPRAALTVERELEVVPPVPALGAPVDLSDLECQLARPLLLSALHVRSLRLLVAGQTVAEAVGDGRGPLMLEHRLFSLVCGELPMQLLATDVEGAAVELLSHSLRVVPRRVQVRISQAMGEFDTVRVKVSGAQSRAVSIPLTEKCVADLPETFFLSLHASGGATVELQLTDDAGALVRQTLRLSPQPMPWHSLPELASLPPPDW